MRRLNRLGWPGNGFAFFEFAGPKSGICFFRGTAAKEEFRGPVVFLSLCRFFECKSSLLLVGSFCLFNAERL